MTLHFFFKKTGRPELIDLVLEPVQQFLFFGYGAGTFVDIKRD